MTLGNAIKIIRTARGVSQRDLARKLKMSANYLSLVESNKREPSLSFLGKLAKALKVPVGMFFMWEGQPIPGVQPSDLQQLRELLVRMETLLADSKDKAHGKKEPAA